MKKVLLALGAFGLLATLAIAQVTQLQVTGNECWSAGQGPGGPSQFLCINAVSNRSQMTVVSGSGAATTVMTQGQSTLMWDGAAPTTWAITLPTPAWDGQIVTIGTETTLTTMVTVTAPAGQTLNATYNSQTLTAVTSVEFQYTHATTTWYRLR
jgi:hypothetical protein